MKENNKGFTLIELLVVVVIIGILAAIALPQYRKVVLKARLHTGIPLVESLYEAEQSYYMLHGAYSNDIDTLDVEMPHDASCEKWKESGYSGWDCHWGSVEVDGQTAEEGGEVSVNFMYPVMNWGSRSVIEYLHLLEDWPVDGIPGGKFIGGKRYCFARPEHKVANDVCKEIGGTLLAESGAWNYYELH